MLAKKLDRRVAIRAIIEEHFLDVILLDVTEDENRGKVPIISFSKTVPIEKIPRLVRKVALRLDFHYIVFCPPEKVRPQLVYKLKDDLFLKFCNKKGFVSAEVVDVKTWLQQNKKKERRF